MKDDRMPTFPGAALGVAPMLSRRQYLTAGLSVGVAATLGLPLSTHAQVVQWDAIQQAAKGQRVFFNAWGGSAQINAYIAWVAQQVKRRWDIDLVHVKVSDIAQTVARIRQEFARGKTSGGSVDMLWINGENFAQLKRQGALFGPFTQRLPNMRWVDTVGKPTTLVDFGEPTEGLEAPWGMAQLSFFADSQRLLQPPRTVDDWMQLAKAKPGQLSYPKPPDFHGTTWLKQWLLALNADTSSLYQPWTNRAFERATSPLWNYLDALHPYLWRQGKQFPQSAAEIRQNVADQSMLIGITFNPNEAASEVAAGRLPPSTHTFQLEGGTIGNTHFLAIPRNANAPAGAQVVIDYLLSPEAQSRKADVKVWGDPTVLNLALLDASQRAGFATPDAPGALRQPQPTRPEPHASWVQPLEDAWTARYAR